jgi:hypothetical protein
MTVHYAIVNDWGLFAETNSACGNNFRRAKKLTDDPSEVTCKECRKLCGFDAVEQPVRLARAA